MIGLRETPEVRRAIKALGNIWECTNESEIVRRCILKIAKQHRIYVSESEEVLA